MYLCCIMKHMTYTAKVTAKGTITIPVNVRRRLGLIEGGEIKYKYNLETGKYSISAVPSLSNSDKGKINI